MCQVSCHSVTILTRQCYSQTCKRCLIMIRMESMIWAIKLKKFLLSLAEIKTGEENCILHSEHRETSVACLSDADICRYEGEARPEPVYEETEEDQQRKRFVPNYNYKPYARQY